VPGDLNGRHAQGSQELADLAFIAGTVTGREQQLAAAFTGVSSGKGAVPGDLNGPHARGSQELADLVFIADLLDPHAKARGIAGASPTSAVSVN
jgi:hypothetical protein